MQLVPIPSEKLVEAWPTIAPFAEQIASRFPDEWPVAVIAEAANARELQLWVVWDEKERKVHGVVGTRIITKASGKRVLDLAWMAGEGRERWMSLLSVLEDYGRHEGCVAIEFVGRWGWQPDLPSYQVKRLAAYEKDLSQVARSDRRHAA